MLTAMIEVIEQSGIIARSRGPNEGYVDRLALAIIHHPSIAVWPPGVAGLIVAYVPGLWEHMMYRLLDDRDKYVVGGRMGWCMDGRIELLTSQTARLEWKPIWIPLPPSWRPRCGTAITRTIHGGLLATGGYIWRSGWQSPFITVSDAAIFNPRTREWISVHALNYERHLHVMLTCPTTGGVCVVSGRVCVVSGQGAAFDYPPCEWYPAGLVSPKPSLVSTPKLFPPYGDRDRAPGSLCQHAALIHPHLYVLHRHNFRRICYDPVMATSWSELARFTHHGGVDMVLVPLAGSYSRSLTRWNVGHPHAETVTRTCLYALGGTFRGMPLSTVRYYDDVRDRWVKAHWKLPVPMNAFSTHVHDRFLVVASNLDARVWCLDVMYYSNGWREIGSLPTGASFMCFDLMLGRSESL